MWLALTNPRLALTRRQLLAVFDPYRPDGLTAKVEINTLHDRLWHDEFRTDTNNLIAGGRFGYDIDMAAQLTLTRRPRRLLMNDLSL
jgi:hypothetical protein